MYTMSRSDSSDLREKKNCMRCMIGDKYWHYRDGNAGRGRVMKKKIVKYICIALGVCIIVYHIFWIYNYLLFTKYVDGLDELVKFQSYSVLEDDFIYHVKFPYYLYFTGNLAVSTKDSEYTLIIWPSRFRDTRYGVRIPFENNGFTEIMLNQELKSEYAEDQIYIDENKEQIEELFYRASERWIIE